MSLTTYYVSNTDGSDSNNGTSRAFPFKSVAPLVTLGNAKLISPTDTILFKRGDVFPGTVMNWITDYYKERLQIATYGNGNKPLFDMYKYIKKEAWVLHSAGVWKVNLSNVANFTGWINNNSGNVGFLKVNGKIFGMKKKQLADLSQQWDFWDDTVTGGFTLYVKSASNPGYVYANTEIAASVRGASSLRLSGNVDFYDLAIIGHGAHAASCSSAHNMSYNNLDIKEIGGSTLTSFVPNPTVRHGNGIEVNTYARNVLVQGCYFETVYDAAMTCQGGITTGNKGFENIVFRGNWTKQCEQAFEFWLHSPVAYFKNIKVHENFCEESGMGALHFGHQAGYGLDQFLGVHILLTNSQVDMNEIEMFNNVFDRSANGLYLFVQNSQAAINKLVNSHNNVIYLNVGQKIMSINDKWKARNLESFTLATGLERDSKIFEVIPDSENIIKLSRSPSASIDANDYKKFAASPGLRHVWSLAEKAFKVI